MAADILTTGACEIKGFADDGETQVLDVLKFDGWTQKITPSVTWDNPAATIYQDIKKKYVNSALVQSQEIDKYIERASR